MAGRKLPAYHRTCDICGREFMAHNPRQKRCSSACTNTANKIRSQECKALNRQKQRQKGIDGVSVSIRSKVLEAKQLGISYGMLQARLAGKKK